MIIGCVVRVMNRVVRELWRELWWLNVIYVALSPWMLKVVRFFIVFVGWKWPSRRGLSVWWRRVWSRLMIMG